MKTTAEQKLMRSLEKLVDSAARTMKRGDFIKAYRQTHQMALDVIRKHRVMMELWGDMDERMQARAKKHLASKGIR